MTGRGFNLTILIALVLLLLFPAHTAAAETGSDPFRAAQKGIDWITDEVKVRTEMTGCVGCHVQGDVLFGLSIASARGYKVDKSSQNGIRYVADFISLAQNGNGGIGWHPNTPEGILEWSQNAINLHSGLGIAAYDRYVGSDYRGNLLALAEWVVSRQQSDGSWYNDFFEAPVNQGDIQATGAMIYVLSQAKQEAAPEKQHKYQKAIELGVDWLRQQVPVTTQDYAFLIIGLKAGGVSADDNFITVTKEALVKAQLGDGGWAERPGLGSSPYATGQAIYSLRTAGLRSDNWRIQEGIKYLLSTQTQAGYWSEGNRKLTTDARRPSRFLSTIWPVIALADIPRYGSQILSVNGMVSQGNKITGSTTAGGILYYKLTLKNSAEDPFDLHDLQQNYVVKVSVDKPGWITYADFDSITVDENGTAEIVLTVRAPEEITVSQTAAVTVKIESRTAAKAKAAADLVITFQIKASDSIPPQPQLLLDNGSRMAGRVIVGETGPQDAVSNLFQYSSDGIVWITIGNDTNGSDGWWVVWDTLKIPDGTYFIKAVMTDEGGLQGSQIRTVEIINQSIDDLLEIGGRPFPESSLADGSIVSGVLGISMTCPVGVVEGTVQYSTDGLNWTTVGTDKSGSDGWSLMWDTSQIPSGLYYVRCVVKDAEGNYGEQIVTVYVTDGRSQPDIGDLPIPKPLWDNGSVFTGVVELEVYAPADTATALFQYSQDCKSWVDLNLDNDSSDGWTGQWENGENPEGKYYIKCILTDFQGLSWEVIRVIYVSHSFEPVLYIKDGTIISGISLIGEVGPPDTGSVLFQYSEKGIEWIDIGTDTDGRNGWWVLWDTGNLTDGSYFIRTAVTGSAGKIKYSSAVLEVNNRGIDEILRVGGYPYPQVLLANGTVITGAMAVGEIGPSGVIGNLFTYSSDGINWNVIGDDTDGSDGWWVQWDTSSLADGKYYVSARMRGADGVWGEQVIVVYVNNRGTQNNAAKLPYPRLYLKNGSMVRGNIRVEEDGPENAVVNLFQYSSDGVNWVTIGNDTYGRDGWWVNWNTTQIPDGRYYLKATMSDDKGLSGENIIVIMVDNTPPVINYSGPPDGCYSENQVVRYGVTDNFDKAPEVTASYPPGTILEQEGVYEIIINAADAAGNSTVETHRCIIDKTPPLTEISFTGTLAQNGWYKSEVKVTLTSKDNLSGVAEIYYSLDGGTSWVKYTEPFMFNEDSMNTVKFYSFDTAGNTEPVKTRNIGIDTTPPVTSIIVKGPEGNNGWFTGSVNVVLESTDMVSGVDSTMYSIDGGLTWHRYTGTLVISTEGKTLIKFYSVDKAGNVEETRTETVLIDTIPPVVTANLSSGLYDPVKITLSVSEEAKIYYTVDGTTPTENGNLYTGPINIDATTTLKFLGVDRAGNKSEVYTEIYEIYIKVPIDIKPGSFPNSVNLKSKGKVPVAILGSSSLDATDINPETVRFAGASPVGKANSIEDVNGDGLLDLVLHFDTSQIGLNQQSTLAFLTGEKYSGEHIKGSDTIRVVH